MGREVPTWSDLHDTGMGDEDGNTIFQWNPSGEIKVLREALLRLREWDMLTLDAEGRGVVLSDAPWAIKLIDAALDATAPAARTPDEFGRTECPRCGAWPITPACFAHQCSKPASDDIEHDEGGSGCCARGFCGPERQARFSTSPADRGSES